MPPSRTHCPAAAAQNDRIGGVPNYRPRRGHEGQPREGSVATTATEGSDVGSRTDVCDTPDRRPRPPVDAWGTPPNSSDKNMGDGRGAGGAGGGVTGGLLPSLTGEKNSRGAEAARKVQLESGTNMQICGRGKAALSCGADETAASPSSRKERMKCYVYLLNKKRRIPSRNWSRGGPREKKEAGLSPGKSLDQHQRAPEEPGFLPPRYRAGVRFFFLFFSFSRTFSLSPSSE